MEEIIDIDLNQQPRNPDESVLGLGSLISDIETVHVRIEERIQQLQAITSRAMQRRRRHQGEISLQPATLSLSSDNKINSHKRCSSHLIAKALETKTEANSKKMKNSSSKEDGFFDCNICFDIPREPIVTCCGHMFCWPCFFKIDEEISGGRVCPVCEGEVSQKHIIPVYGGSNVSYRSEAEKSGIIIPSRPPACRVQPLRQLPRANRVVPRLPTLGFTTFHSEEPLNHIVTGRGESSLSPEQDFLAENHYGRRSSQRIASLLSQEAASLSSLSSTLSTALNSVETIVGELETIIHNRRANFTNLEERVLDVALDIENPIMFLPGEGLGIEDHENEESRESRRRRLR